MSSLFKNCVLKTTQWKRSEGLEEEGEGLADLLAAVRTGGFVCVREKQCSPEAKKKKIILWAWDVFERWERRAWDAPNDNFLIFASQPHLDLFLLPFKSAHLLISDDWPHCCFSSSSPFQHWNKHKQTNNEGWTSSQCPGNAPLVEKFIFPCDITALQVPVIVNIPCFQFSVPLIPLGEYQTLNLLSSIRGVCSSITYENARQSWAPPAPQRLLVCKILR